MTCTIEIGGTPTAFQFQHAAFLELLKGRYARYLTSRESRFNFTVEVSSTFASDPDAEMKVTIDGDSCHAQRGDFRAQWDLTTGKGIVTLRTPSLYAVDSLLRIVHSIFLAHSSQPSAAGFLLHSASAIRNRRAFLFSGLSGAGKTTISRLAPHDVALLTDEISYVRRNGDEFSASGTPFAGELGAPGENQSGPVVALYFLEKGPENQIAPIAPADASRRLLRNILFLTHNKPFVDRIFRAACDFVSLVPTHRLIFVPDQRVWDIIE